MTKGFGRALALASAACALLASLAVAQKKPAPGTGGRSQPSSDQGPAAKAGEGALPKTVMDEMTRYATPGPQHRELAALAVSPRLCALVGVMSAKSSEFVSVSCSVN